MHGYNYNNTCYSPDNKLTGNQHTSQIFVCEINIYSDKIIMKYILQTNKYNAQ